MDTDFCCSVLKEAIQYNKPGIFNTDQGSHGVARRFTSEAFTSILVEEKPRPRWIKVSMDGKGRAIDNIFAVRPVVERLWRSVNGVARRYEYLYLQRPETCQQLYEGLQDYFQFYNYERLHQSLDYQPPEVVYRSLTA